MPRFKTRIARIVTNLITLNGLESTGYKKQRALCHPERSEECQIVFDFAKRAISRDVSLTLNMTVQSMCAGRNPCAVSWTSFARHVLFWLLHAEILYQDVWLPDERARLRTGRAFARGARLRARRARIGSRRCAPEHMQCARHG